MKKLFTSVAAACLAVAGVNAQTWQVTGDVIAENSVLVDNEYAKVTTANQDGTVYTLTDTESKQPTTITLGDYSFTKAVNIRVTDAPSKDSPTGTANSADDGTQNIALVVEAKQHTDVTLYYRIGKTKSLSVYNQTTDDSESGTQTTLSEDDKNYYASNLLQLKGGNTYTIYAKGGTVQFYGLDVAAGSYTEPSAFIYANTSAATVEGYSTMTYSDGAKVVLNGNASKAFANGSSIKINGKNYTTTKVSNGAQNTFYAPAGKKVYTFTLYSYVNKDAATVRTPYWQEINGEKYDETTATIMQSYKDGENPDVNTYTFKDGVESLTFTNAGEQVCFVIEADYSAVATGITSANETVSAPINKVIENGRITILRNNTKYSVAGTILK